MNVLTTSFARLASAAMYGVGHGVSRVMHKANLLGNLYPAYNWCMTKSVDIEEWAGIEFMWRKPAKQ